MPKALKGMTKAELICKASALRVVTDTGEGFEAGHGGESDRLGGWALPSI